MYEANAFAREGFFLAGPEVCIASRDERDFSEKLRFSLWAAL